MEEREKLWIYVVKRDREWYLGWSSLMDKVYIFVGARSNARHRYVDRLTEKQRDAINFIKMLDDEEFIENVGGKTVAVSWVRPVRKFTVYVLDC